MKATVFAILGATILTGCSVFTTSQKDIRYGDKTKVITRTTSWTLFTSKSDLANFRVTQTEKTQSAQVGTLNQNSQEPQALTNINLKLGL